MFSSAERLQSDRLSPRPYVDIILETLGEEQQSTRSHLAKMITQEHNVLSPGTLSKTLGYLIRSNSIKMNRDGTLCRTNPLSKSHSNRHTKESDSTLSPDAKNCAMAALYRRLDTLEKRIATLEQQQMARSVAVVKRNTTSIQNWPGSRKRQICAEDKRRKKANTGTIKKGHRETAVKIKQKLDREFHEDVGIARKVGVDALPVQFANMIRGGESDRDKDTGLLVWHYKYQDEPNATWTRLPESVSRQIQDGYEIFAIHDRSKHTLVCKENDDVIQYVTMLGTHCGKNARFCRMRTNET